MLITHASRFIVPIFEMGPSPASGQSYYPLVFRGTGFIIARNLLVTCWHCVDSVLQSDHHYGILIELHPESRNKPYAAVHLDNIHKDCNGSNLATADLQNGEYGSLLTLSTTCADAGGKVWTLGYPDTIVKDRDIKTNNPKAHITERYFETYITRAFYYEHPRYDQVPSFELAMPAPRGLSGAPIVRVNSVFNEVVGVIYGNNDVDTIERSSRIPPDPDTGECEPRVQRVVSYALAHYTETLWKLKGPATQERPLVEFAADH